MHMPLLKELQLENQRLREDINSQPTGQAEGENITIEDGTGARFKKLEISGNSWQKVTEQGNNLVGGQFEKGIYNTSGVLTNTNGIYRTFKTKLKEGTYRYNLNREQVTVISPVNITTQELLNIISGVKFTLENPSEIAFSFRKTDSSNWDLGENLADIEVMINEGETSKPYEPFIPNSPSPEYQSPIRNCGDNINLFDEKWTGTVSTNFIPVVKGEEYIYSEQNLGVSVFYDFYENTEQEEAFSNSVMAYKTFIPEENGYVKLRKFTTTKIECKLEKGTKVTPYSPYNCGNVNFKITNKADKEQTAIFPTKEGQVFHKRDYLADDGTHHVRETIELDGNENWKTIEQNDGYPVRYSCKDSDKAKNKRLANGLSTHFKNWYSNGRSNYYTEEGIGVNVDKEINIYVKDETIGGHGETYLKEWLAKQKTNGTPLKIEYELENEIIEPYSEEQKKAWEEIKNLRGYNGKTYIFSDDEIKPYIKAEYLKNTDLEHQKLQNQIDEIKELISTSSTSAMLLDNLEKDLLEEV